MPSQEIPQPPQFSVTCGNNWDGAELSCFKQRKSCVAVSESLPLALRAVVPLGPLPPLYLGRVLWKQWP